MTAYNTLCTSSSASLSATLPYSDLHGQYPLYPVSPIVKSQDAIHSDINDDLSSSDKENCSPHTSRRLNRASSTSPVMTSLLHKSQATEIISFTPQRVQAPPRAWERRPATPYIQRNEGQKIWKRIPLQDLGIEINQQVPRREDEEKQNYIRVVKRLRLDKSEEGVSTEAERKQIASAIGTRWVDDCIEKNGSPKKKPRNQNNTSTTAPQDHGNGTRLAFGNLSNTYSNECGSNSAKQDTDEKQNSMNEDSNNANSQEHKAEESVKFSGARELDEHGDGEIEEATRVASVTENAGSERSEQTLNKPTTKVSEISSSENGRHLENLIEGAVTQVRDSGLDPAETLFANDKEILTCLDSRNVSTNYASLSDTSDKAMFDSATVLSGGNSFPANSSVLSTTARITEAFLTSDHDETAFLRDFLERAQASKAIKNIPSPQKKISEALASCAQHIELGEKMVLGDAMEAIDDIEDDDLSPPVETAKVERPLFTNNDNARSPTRRSTRTSARATSCRLPRFQIPQTNVLPSQQSSFSLPAAIQLKRATGTEFIFNAKSQQNLAMLTRSNTKRNQGDAIHVAQRLAQLKKELEIRLQDELVAEVDASQNTQYNEEEISMGNEIENGTMKRRKHDKQDRANPSRIRKTVKWPNEEDLVKCREPALLVDCSEICDSPESNVSTALPVLESVEATGIANATNSADSDSGSKLVTKTRTGGSDEDTSKLKVRRIRKIKLDSVNGTPAPKTRSRLVTQPEVAESSVAASSDMASTSSSSSSSNTRKSSRMPIPVSTPIPLPGLTTSKSKAKTTEKGKDPAKSRVSSSTSSSIPNPSTETVTAIPSTRPDDKSTDLTTNSESKPDSRRRRLRTRS